MGSESLTARRVEPYLLVAAVALAVRLAVIPFVYRDWLDPFVLEHWAFGFVARFIVSGHGFGNVFAPNTGATAVLPPVYSYLLAGIFKIFGIETRASVLAALSLNSLFSALTCVPVVLIARKVFGERVAKWAGWGWAFSPYGVYYGADWAWSTCLVRMASGELFTHARLAAVRLVRRIRSTHRAGRAVGRAVARPLDDLPPISHQAVMESPHARRSIGRHRHHVAVAGAQL